MMSHANHAIPVSLSVRHNAKYQRGLSMIELMIAIVIGLLLLSGTASLMINNKRIYREQNEMARLQENVRFAMEILIKDIRRAGYAGCMDRIQNVNSTVNGGGNDTFLMNFKNPVEGSESASNWYPSNSTEATVDMLPGSDGITLKFLEPIGVTLRDDMPLVSAELKVYSVGPLVEGEIIALTDCDSADIMQMTQIQAASISLQHNPGNTNPSPGNSTASLSKRYNEGAEVVRFVARRYFVGTSPVTGETGLYRYAQDLHDFDNDGDRAEFITQELIEGVENMQILYGEDTAGNDSVADTFVSADAVTNWDDVVTARISLLMHTIKEDFTTPLNSNASYNLLGSAVPTAQDHRHRRIFSSTIMIRNRRG